ncbi:MAG: hypothetical protein V4490_08455 [Pseudomonadota bacterium]
MKLLVQDDHKHVFGGASTMHGMPNTVPNIYLPELGMVAGTSVALGAILGAVLTSGSMDATGGSVLSGVLGGAFVLGCVGAVGDLGYQISNQKNTPLLILETQPAA